MLKSPRVQTVVRGKGVKANYADGFWSPNLDNRHTHIIQYVLRYTK